MSVETEIEWCDATWNPMRGCTPVSAGCKHCYAMHVAARFSGHGQPYEGLARRTPDGVRWTGTVRLVPEALGLPLRWRQPKRIFVDSMSDLFHEALKDEEIAAVFGVMAAAPRHTFIVLTKRATRMREWFAWLSAADGGPANSAAREAIFHGVPNERMPLRTAGISWPLQNVILGVSVENQATADERVPLLLATPAACRAVSYEPAISPVDFAPWLRGAAVGGAGCRGLDLVIVGGESGPGARPFDLAWARSTIEACREARCACFLKQLGARPILRDRYDVSEVRFNDLDAVGWDENHGPPTLRDRKGGDPAEWSEDLRVREWPTMPRGEAQP